MNALAAANVLVVLLAVGVGLYVLTRVIEAWNKREIMIDAEMSEDDYE